jgi:hypothetical protein
MHLAIGKALTPKHLRLPRHRGQTESNSHELPGPRTTNRRRLAAEPLHPAMNIGTDHVCESHPAEEQASEESCDTQDEDQRVQVLAPIDRKLQLTPTGVKSR